MAERKENYDLITVVMICLGNEDDKNGKGLIRLLSVLLSTDKRADEKKRILEEEFNIAMSEEMEKEADEMCDYSNYVEEKGIKKGIEQGLAVSLKNLIKNANMTLEQAMAVLEIPETDREMYAGRLES